MRDTPGRSARAGAPTLFFALLPLSSSAAAPRLLRIAGSSTVFPVASRWGQALPLNYTFIDGSGDGAVCTSKSGVANFTLCGGGSSTGARRVCAPRGDPSHVDVGDMSRDWKDSEAVRLDDGYTLECLASKIRVTQLVVGADGLAVVVAKNGPAHDCLLIMGGLTLAQLRWMFSNWDDETLQNDKDGDVDLASVAPNDNGNGIKEWRDLNSQCAELPINTYGAGSESGTFSFFGEVVLCKKCFGAKSGYTAEGFSFCNASDIRTLEHLSTPGEIDGFMRTRRRPNCYMPSEDDHQILQWVLADTKGIAYFGYAYYAENMADLTVSRIADDKVKGAADTADAFVMPTTYTITDGSYSVFRRSLFMNVDNRAWPLVKDYLAFGYSDAGLALVANAGYVVVNSALRAKMQQRVEEGGNAAADYVTSPPDECAAGTELSQEPYTNRFGRAKVNYTCKPCPPGRSKRTATPTLCVSCAEGSFQALWGQMDCSFARPGEFAVAGAANSTRCPVNSVAPMPGRAACTPCDPGSHTQSTGATACLRCGLGRYRGPTDSECLLCPAGMTTEFRAAASPTDCACASGTYQRPGDRLSAPCLPCPEGMACAFGSRADNFAAWTPLSQLPTPLLKRHYWSDPGSPLSVYLCRMEDESCPGGQPGSCGGGRLGPLCAACPDGQALSDGECRPCSQAVALLPILLPLVALVLICCTHYLANSPVGANLSAASACAVTFSQLLTIAQIFSMYSDLNINWPGGIRDIFGPMALSTGAADILSLECALGSGALAKYLIRCSLPLSLLIMIAILHLASYPFSALVRRVQHWSFDKSLNTAAQLLQAVFIGLAAIVVVPLQCYLHPNGSSSMRWSPEVLCWEGGEHSALVGLAACVALLFVVPFMAYCLYGTHQVVRYTPPDEWHHRSLVRFRFLLFRFREDTWWWGNTFMVRQLLLAFAPSLNSQEPLFQCTFVISVLTLYGFLQAHFWPWKGPELNALDALLTGGLVVVIATSTAFFEQTQSTGSYAVVLLLLICCLLLSTVVLSCYILVTAFLQWDLSSFGKDNYAARVPVMATEFYHMCEAVAQQGPEDIAKAIQAMSYYDRKTIDQCSTVYRSCKPHGAGLGFFKRRVVGVTRRSSVPPLQVFRGSQRECLAAAAPPEDGGGAGEADIDSYDDLGLEVQVPPPFRSKWNAQVWP